MSVLPGGMVPRLCEQQVLSCFELVNSIAFRFMRDATVVQKGEIGTFVVQAFDPQRRGIELGMPGFATVAGGPTEETVEAEISSEGLSKRAAGSRSRAKAKRSAAAATNGAPSAPLPAPDGPAGTVEPGEDPAVCAHRELIEEAGLHAERLVPLGEARPLAAATAVAHLFLAEGLTEVPRQPETYERDMITLRLPLDEALDAALEGEIRHATSIAALARAARA